MKQFEVPEFYRSPLISEIKKKRKDADKLKKDFTPTYLEVNGVQFYLARHFGFCYGVENAIEIAFRAVEENKGKRIFLLSEMIHNPQVNSDLISFGVQFIQDTMGNPIIPWNEITANDIVIIPAFGTTTANEELLRTKGIDPLKYNSTCPFVERVWKKANQIAGKSYSIIIHGKPTHEETKATFSHSAQDAPSLIIKDMKEAQLVADFINNQLSKSDFETIFKDRYSIDFNPDIHLERIGVVNQTTMLAEDTQAISEYLKNVMATKYQLSEENIEAHFADTRDTLCYATNDNQTAVKGMLEQDADLAIVVGGYNSSNTSHLVELCEEKLPTYFIKDITNIISKVEIVRYHFRTGQEEIVSHFLPSHNSPKILVTSGASCPDAVVEAVINKIASFYANP
jgi:4-hydroxy-3-methylbut-2-en-1-yl diphosphate reductase